MALLVVTGPVRSGKSRVAAGLAARSGRSVVAAVAGRADDAEMARRIERHRAERPAAWRTLEVVDPRAWLGEVAPDACLLVDCLGSLVSRLTEGVAPDADGLVSRADEDAVERAARALTDALLARDGDTVVVSNETGWSVVAPDPIARLFTDVLARATARLVDGAQAAWLVVAGRCIGLNGLPRSAAWPQADRERM